MKPRNEDRILDMFKDIWVLHAWSSSYCSKDTQPCYHNSLVEHRDTWNNISGRRTYMASCTAFGYIFYYIVKGTLKSQKKTIFSCINFSFMPHNETRCVVTYELVVSSQVRTLPEKMREKGMRLFCVVR